MEIGYQDLDVRPQCHLRDGVGDVIVGGDTYAINEPPNARDESAVDEFG